MAAVGESGPIGRRGRSIALAAAALVLMFGPGLAAHARHAAGPLRFADDARPWVSPFLLSCPSSEYARAALLPVGYDVLYAMAAWATDATVLSKAIPYPLLLATAAAAAATAARLGGAGAGFGAAALALSSGLLLSDMAGGTPRAFAFPLAAAAAAALAWGRTSWLCGLVILAAAFYPPLAVTLGAALSLEVVALPARHRGQTQGWTAWRRLLLVAATAVAAAAMVYPRWAAKDYGPSLTARDLEAYPELGPHGRFGEGDRRPYPGLGADVQRSVKRTLKGTGPPWSNVLREWGRRPLVRGGLGALVAISILVGFGSLAAREAAALRVLLLGVGAGVAHAVSTWLDPRLYVPQRAVIHAAAVLVLIALPAGAAALPALFGRRRGVVPAGTWAGLAMTMAVVLLAGGRVDEEAGLTIDHRQDARFFAFVAALPERSVIAGWPQEDGIVDSVPYLARRESFLTYEMLWARHPSVLDALRLRMRALVAAVFAAEPGPLLRLRDEWGVTHLVVDRRHYEGSLPPSFEPFTAWVEEAAARGRGPGFEVPRQWPHAAVFTEGPLAVLELGRLRPGGPSGRPPQ